MTRTMIMKRAWEIYRTLTGDHAAKLAIALKQAWTEAKGTAKKAFEGMTKVAKMADTYDECCYLTFKAWSKGNKKRIYINDYKRRTLGYIENNEVIINDRQGNTQVEIDFAINNFRNTYSF